MSDRLWDARPHISRAYDFWCVRLHTEPVGVRYYQSLGTAFECAKHLWEHRRNPRCYLGAPNSVSYQALKEGMRRANSGRMAGINEL